MHEDFVLLVEKEAMWAKMLEQVLKDNDVEFVSAPIYGAAVVLRAGVQERHQIFVPQEQLAQAQELLDELFSNVELSVDPEDQNA